DSGLNPVGTIPISITTEYIQDIEVDNTGTILYLGIKVDASTYQVRSYNMDGSNEQTQTIQSTGQIKKIHHYGDKLYVLQAGASTMQKLTLLGDGHLSSATPQSINQISFSNISMFHIANDIFYTAGDGNKVYTLDLATQIGSL